MNTLNGLRILFCCEFYAPSVGGVQEVMRQLAERLVLHGNEVTVATTTLSNRRYNELNGVRIKQFRVTGNFSRGMAGELTEYRDYVTSGNFDIILIKAAQQWTFDALWPVLDDIKPRKIFIPCGFSCLYEPDYAQYFRLLPPILRKFDHLIFYASDYRDINFAKENGIENFSIIPNGASEIEFAIASDCAFRKRHGIRDSELLLLTVGNPPVQKGQLEVAEAFRIADFSGQPATLILNGNWFPKHKREVIKGLLDTKRRLLGAIKRDADVYRKHGLVRLLKNIFKRFLIGLRLGFVVTMLGYKVAGPEQLSGIFEIITRINKQKDDKKVLIVDLPRGELVQAFMAADLFIFASKVEYSPLVLYESAAAGTAFLSVPVGNAEEIACLTGSGVICPAPKDDKGYVQVDPKILAAHLSEMARDRNYLNKLGATGRQNWREKFTWEKISVQYEAIFNKVHRERVAIT